MSGATAAAAVVIAIALDAAVGDPPNAAHPVAWMGRLLAVGRRHLARGGAARLLITGGALTIAVAVAAAVAGLAVHEAAHRLGPGGAIIEGVVLSTLLSIRGLVSAAALVAAALRRGDLAAARGALAFHLVSRDTSALAAGHVASGAVESVAENLTDALVAPVCFYLVLGLPGAAAYRAINTADAMIGYRDGALEYFGKVAARLDDALNLVPARLAAAALVAAAPLAGASARGAAKTMARDARSTASPNAGCTMAAMAGALGVTLEKIGAYRLGDGRLAVADDVDRAVRLTKVAATLVVSALLAGRILLWPGQLDGLS